MKLKKIIRRKGFTLVELLVVIAIIASLAALSSPVIIRALKKGYMNTASHNARQVHGMLTEFSEEFYAYPNDVTAGADADLKEFTGDHSNDYLGQILAGGFVDTEENFFARDGSSSGVTKEADNKFNTKEETLATGECGLAYVKGLSSSSKSTLPVLMAPMDSKTTFNESAYGNNAVAVRVDGSAQTYRLSKKRQAKLADGNTLFQSGEDTMWGDIEPEVLLAK